jgi:hypothetical protein
LLESIDLRLQGLQPLLKLLDEGRDHPLRSKRDLVPEFSRDRGLRLHAAKLWTVLGSAKNHPVNVYAKCK